MKLLKQLVFYFFVGAVVTMVVIGPSQTISLYKKTHTFIYEKMHNMCKRSSYFASN